MTTPAGDPDRPTDRPVDRPVLYAVRVQGRLAPRWGAWFGGMSVLPDQDGTTTLRGPLPDQAALHGVLAGLRDLGIPLLSVTTLPPTDHPSHAPSEGTSS
jgi:hypothetical protein